MSGVLRDHRPVDLLMQQLARGKGHAKLLLESQYREANLGMTDKLYDQEPYYQRRLGEGHETYLLSARSGIRLYRLH